MSSPPNERASLPQVQIERRGSSKDSPSVWGDEDRTQGHWLESQQRQEDRLVRNHLLAVGNEGVGEISGVFYSFSIFWVLLT